MGGCRRRLWTSTAMACAAFGTLGSRSGRRSITMTTRRPWPLSPLAPLNGKTHCPSAIVHGTGPSTAMDSEGGSTASLRISTPAFEARITCLDLPVPSGTVCECSARFRGNFRGETRGHARKRRSAISHFGIAATIGRGVAERNQVGWIPHRLSHRRRQSAALFATAAGLHRPLCRGRVGRPAESPRRRRRSGLLHTWCGNSRSANQVPIECATPEIAMA